MKSRRKLRFRDIGLRNKMMLVLMATSLAVLIPTITLFIINDVYLEPRENISTILSSVSEIIAENERAPLLFGDALEAEAVLQSLKKEPHISAAYLYDKKGNLLATYKKGEYPKSPEPGYWYDHTKLPEGWTTGASEYENIKEGVHIESDHIDVFKIIRTNGAVLGALYMEYSQGILTGKIKKGVLIGVLITFFSFLALYFLSLVFHRVITRPIWRLRDTMKQIASKGDYRTRIDDDREDELGELIKAFNEMLSQIDVRDKELERHRSDLEKMVDEKAAEIVRKNRELRDAVKEAVELRKKAEEANQAKSTFLAGVGHEVRTPLNSILGFTEVLLDGKAGLLTEKQREYVMDIMDSATHLNSLINDIIDMAKIDIGKVSLNLEYANPELIIERAYNMLKERLTKKNITFLVSKHSVPDMIRVDERRILQVVFNLLMNAFKFTQSGGRIEVILEGVEKSDLLERIPPEFMDDFEINDIPECRHLLITVKDNGIGIDKEAQKRIFEPFQQADPSITKRYGGTGLGLAITRDIVKLHGGVIWVVSEAGKGSRFTFSLPMRDDR